MNNDKKQLSLHALISYFDRDIKLSEEEKELIASKFTFRKFKKHQYVLQEGDICRYFNFVICGCLRIYNIDESGNIHILQFAVENWWINDLNSFYNSKPSVLTIDALEDTELLQIAYEDLQDLYKLAPKFNLIFRKLVEKAYSRLQERLLENISSKGEDRYIAFAERYPFLLNRLSQIQIAAYLGVTPEFLSRVKNKPLRPAPPKS